MLIVLEILMILLYHSNYLIQVSDRQYHIPQRDEFRLLNYLDKESKFNPRKNVKSITKGFT
jgi:hypothetical protein